MKTLAIRLEEDAHQQLSMIAQLEGLTMIDAIRRAINDWVAARRDNPELKERAQSLLDEIEQEAASRRGAIASLIGGAAPPEVTAPAVTPDKEEPPQSGRRKGAMGFQPSRPATPRGGTPATS